MSSQIQCSVCECSEESCESCKAPDKCSNCVSCCCTETHSSWRRQRIKQGLRLEYFSIAWMSFEVIGSIIAGVIASSFALIAFGADSVIELASAVVVLRHLHLDSDGSTTQGKKTAIFTSLLLLSLVPVIGASSTYSFVVLKIQPSASILGLAVAIGAVAIMPYLWRKKRQIGLETSCLPLSIDALESATCFIMSLALLSGLSLEFIFHIGWFDYLATLVILGIIAFEGKESFEKARQDIA